jgi:hypothetical protein
LTATPRKCIEKRVRHGRSSIFWASLITVTLVTSGGVLLAADQPASSDGYKTVPVIGGGKGAAVRVREQPDALAHASFPDELDPQRVFSATNRMANKTFSMPADSVSHGTSLYKEGDRNTFATKPYTFDASSPSVPNADAKFSYPTTSAYNRSATGFDHGYQTSNADAGQNRTALLASATSSDQGRTAILGGQTQSAFASSMSNKTFEGEEADAARRHLTRTKSGQILITDLPNRPLTIDEVRDLINHGFKPDTDARPPEPSKPLNDPDYKPQPLRDDPSPNTSDQDDDKNDPVPAPGTMAAPPAPENSEPLPQP